MNCDLSMGIATGLWWWLQVVTSAGWGVGAFDFIGGEGVAADAWPRLLLFILPGKKLYQRGACTMPRTWRGCLHPTTDLAQKKEGPERRCYQKLL